MLKKTPEYISLFTTILLAVPALLAAAWGVWYSFSGSPPAPPPVPATVELGAESSGGPTIEPLDGITEINQKTIPDEHSEALRKKLAQTCYDLKTKFPPIMPLSLVNSVGTKNFPYWFLISVNNKCEQKLNLTIRWTTTGIPGKPAVRFDQDSEPKQLDLGPSVNNVSPKLEILSGEFPDQIKLTVSWQITDEQQLSGAIGKDEIILLPPDVYQWDLLDAFHEDVNKEFVFASLTNWVITASDNVRNTGQAISRDSGRDRSIDSWLERAYASLFTGPDAVRCSTASIEFPPRSRRPITVPDVVLLERSGDPLEIALTLSAIAYKELDEIRKNEWRLALFAVPEDGQASPRKRFFVAWTTGPDVWRAIDTSQVNTKSFELNRRESTAWLSRLLAEKPILREAINLQGVFVGENATFLALDYKHAKDNPDFKIFNLPQP